MNFTPSLSAFQGALLSADNVHNFSRITSRGGNEEKIIEIVTRLFSFLNSNGYILQKGYNKQKTSDMRRFSFFIILNSDFPALEELIELPGIDMAIWTINTIKKCLVSEIIWGLNMEDFLYEIIEFSNPTLSLQILDPFIDSLKYYLPVENIQRIKSLSYATYKLICRLNTYEFHSDIVDSILTDVSKLFLRCITCFVTPENEYKLERLSESEMYKFKAFNFSAILRLAIDCFGHYKSSNRFDHEGFQELYHLTFRPEHIKSVDSTVKNCDAPNKKILECLQKCNTVIIDKCMDLMMDVSVELFMAWSEFEENGKSLQQIVGELCYVLHTDMQRVDTLSEHALLAMLPQIYRKPVDIHDTISNADDKLLLETITRDTDNRKLYLRAIVKKEYFLKKKEFLECALLHTDLLEESEGLDILNNILYEVKENKCQDNLVKLLAIKLFNKCDINKRHDILSDYFCDNTFNNCMEASNFEESLTEVFNKLVASPDADVCDVLSIFLQSPNKTYLKIISSAVENRQQCDIMLKIMKLLEQYSNCYYNTDTDACIIRVLHDFSTNQLETDQQQNNFTNFVIELKKSGILTGVKLLLLIIMPNMHQALVNKLISIVKVTLQILNQAFTIEELLEYRAPLLAMFGQVMEVVRWNITTFSFDATIVLELTIEMQKKYFSTYQNEIPVKDSTWLKQKLKMLSPLNMYYYRKLWNPPGDDIVEIICGDRNIPNNKLIMFLAKVLFSSTTSEWLEIWDSISKQDDSLAIRTFYKTVLMISEAEKNHHTDVTWACLQFSYRNLVMVTKHKYLKEPLTNQQVETVLENIVTIVNPVEDQRVKDTINIFIPLLSYLVEHRDTYSYDLNIFKDKLVHTSFQSAIEQLMSI